MSHIKCDRHGCEHIAVWAYTVNTLYGIETWNSCQEHGKEVRQMNGQNVQSVKPLR